MKDLHTGYTKIAGFFLTLFSLVLLASVVQATEVSFSWLPNAESTVSGYKIYYGTTSRAYDSFVDVGNPAPVNGRIQGTVTGLIDGTTYYFAVTAYDSANNLESDYSTELSWTASSQSGSGTPPTAANSSVTTSEDQSITGTATAGNDSGLPITYLIQQNVAHGTLSLVSSTGNFTYTPQQNFAGTDSFTFLARDDNGDSNIATVSITVTAVNDPPIAQNVAITVNEDSVTNGQLQASDPDGNTLTYTAVAGPTRGTVTINTSGSFTYTPDANMTGTDSFTFQVSDEQTTSNTATVSITISPVNDVPVAVNGLLTAIFGQTASGTLQASDADNDPLTYSVASDPQHVVTITNSSTGAYTVTPMDGMSSPYTFTFTANDGTATSNTATVTVTLAAAGTMEIFGDTPDSNHPGTLTDTFTNINNDINAAAQEISTYSWSSPTPHKPANTILIKTDLSALPSNIQIIEAKLYLYQTGASGDAAYENSVHKIIGKNPTIDQVTGYNAFNGEPWTPVATGTTYNDIPLGLADIGQTEDTVTLDTQAGYRTWLITDMVQDWVNTPADNFGLLITGVPTTSETGRTFAATENQNGSIRPKLVISYIEKPPKPSVISVRKIK